MTTDGEIPPENEGNTEENRAKRWRQIPHNTARTPDSARPEAVAHPTFQGHKTIGSVLAEANLSGILFFAMGES